MLFLKAGLPFFPFHYMDAWRQTRAYVSLEVHSVHESVLYGLIPFYHSGQKLVLNNV